MNKSILLLGSNLGNKKNNLNNALQYIREEIGEITKQSHFIENEAVEFSSNNTFINIAIEIQTKFSPIKLLNHIKKIEKKLGRIEDTSNTLHYTDRFIDIDIVTFNTMNYKSRRLNIPHQKNLYERDFSRKLICSL